MPNRQNLDIIKLGVDIWNKWRDDNYNPRVDKAIVDLKKANLYRANLREANLCVTNLSEANLSGAYLFRANLSEANLKKADLSGADLFETNLSEADLSEADLSEANLSEANLSGADLSGADLSGVALSEANLSGANLSEANLSEADLSEADLSEADLSEANLREANLKKADLSGADLFRANLSEANLSGADLSGADLLQAMFVNTILEEANLTDCYIYGISAWDIKLNEETIQSDLIITPKNTPKITVDSLEVAQFIYLLLNNKKIRHVIDTITSKVVLILGRFTPERKNILDAIREKLRKFDYLPVLFDFENSENRDITETISLLARMARFVIADITDAKSIPQELMCIVPHLPSVPVQPLLQADKDEYVMFEHFKKYPWVLKIYQYRNLNYLLGSFEKKVIFPAEAKAKKLIKKSINNGINFAVSGQKW